MSTRLGSSFAIAALFIATAAPAAESGPWLDALDVDVVDLITLDEDGDVRTSKVWYVVIDGNVYLRTSRSRWLENTRRDPNFLVRVEGREIPVSSEEVTSDELIEKVDEASLEKYGFRHRFIRIFRIRKPNILKLSPRRR